jgi:hypothetical protein
MTKNIDVVQKLLVRKSVQACPKAIVLMGDKLLLTNQPLKGLLE